MTDEREPNDVLDDIESWLPRKPHTKPLARWEEPLVPTAPPSGPLISPEMAAREHREATTPASPSIRQRAAQAVVARMGFLMQHPATLMTRIGGQS